MSEKSDKAESVGKSTMGDTPGVPSISEDLLRLFAREGYAPVQAEVRGLASVTMDANFQVIAVELPGAVPALTDESRAALEQAVASALNDVIREVGRRNAQLLVQAMGRSGG